MSPIILLLGVATGAWSKYGWVTKETYATDVQNYVVSTDYSMHVMDVEDNFAAQDNLNKEITGSLNEIKALLTIVPQLKALIRNRCGGGQGLEATIRNLKNEYQQLTGQVYVEPACNSPELLSQ